MWIGVPSWLVDILACIGLACIIAYAWVIIGIIRFNKRGFKR